MPKETKHRIQLSCFNRLPGSDFRHQGSAATKAVQNNQAKLAKLQGQIVRLEQRTAQQLHLWRIVCDRGVPIAIEYWLAGTRVWAHWIGNAHCGLEGDNGSSFILCALPTKITRA